MRDSAGTAVVWVSADVWRSKPQLEMSAEPLTRIASTPGQAATFFDQIRSVAQLSDGRILVLDGGSSEIRIFDDAGRFQQRVGRAGAGPGEFRRPRRIMRMRADSFAVFDEPPSLQIFSPQGLPVRSMAVPRDSDGTGEVVAAYDDGTFLITKRIGPSSPFAPGRHPVWLSTFLLRSDGTRSAQLGRHARGEDVYYYMTNGYPDMARPVFDPPVLVAATGTGYLWAHPAEFLWEEWDRSGTPVRIVRVDAPRVRVTQEELTDRHQVLVDRPGVRPDVRSMLQQNFDVADKPEFLPAFADMRVDSEGRIWIRRYSWRASNESASWAVFDMQGRLLASAELPPELSVHEIGRNFVLGVMADSLGQQEVVRIPFNLR